MMFTINRELLTAELAVLQAAAERKTTVPILAFVLVRVSDGLAQLTATDYDVTITTQVEAKGDPYSGCIPIKQLSSLAKLFDSETIQFTEKPNQRIEIKAGTSKHLLATFPAKDFPEVESVEGQTVTVQSDVLAQMLKRTAFCAGQEGEGQGFTFQCVNFEAENKMLTLVATNSKQLGTMSAAIDSNAEFKALIPVRAINALERLCETVGTIEFTASPNSARFQNGDRTLVARLVVGNFPKWKLVLPQSLEHQTTIDPDKLSASVKRVCVTTREAKLIRHPLTLMFSKKKLEITSQSEEGESTDTVPVDCKSLNGTDFDIRVNGEHFINFIARTEGQVSCAFGEDKRLIQLGVEGDDSYKYITMALR
jgi:DNA polymerase-3 subunit beta